MVFHDPETQKVFINSYLKFKTCSMWVWNFHSEGRCVMVMRVMPWSLADWYIWPCNIIDGGEIEPVVVCSLVGIPRRLSILPRCTRPVEQTGACGKITFTLEFGWSSALLCCIYADRSKNVFKAVWNIGKVAEIWIQTQSLAMPILCFSPPDRISLQSPTTPHLKIVWKIHFGTELSKRNPAKSG